MIYFIPTGAIHAGMGHRQAESFLTTIGVPSLHHKTFKRREREVASAIHAVAEQSCSEALQEEANLSAADVPDGPTQGTFKYDMCWQKRGSGRSYDSLSGFIFNFTLIVISFVTKSFPNRFVHAL